MSKKINETSHPLFSDNEDNFKKSFKYFKSKNPPPDLLQVLDFDKSTDLEIHTGEFQPLPSNLDIWRREYGLNAVKDWNIYTISNHPGLIIIRKAFNQTGSMIWVQKCLKCFSGLPYKTNISNLNSSPIANWWDSVKEPLSRNDACSKEVSQLRWATMGYHHNWDTKVYSDAEQSQMPDGLEKLCKVFLYAVGHPQASRYKAEAAIVNYYPPGSTLSPHTDHSEPFREAPLLSFSFGQSAIFLIGGREKASNPTPLFLHHGDVMVMSGESRLCYHAVPRIMALEGARGVPNTALEEFIQEFSNRLSSAINGSEKVIRKATPGSSFRKPSESQLYDTNHMSGCFMDNPVELSAVCKPSETQLNDTNHMSDNYMVNPVGLNATCKPNESQLYETNYMYDSFVNNPVELNAILNYVKMNRININVRQVNYS